MTRDDPDSGGEVETEVEGRDETAVNAAAETRPRPELRWVQLREPLQAIELGRNGRVLATRYHEGYDSWEVLLETYEGEGGGEQPGGEDGPPQ